jgi:hypothetical protein
MLAGYVQRPQVLGTQAQRGRLVPAGDWSRQRFSGAVEDFVGVGFESAEHFAKLLQRDLLDLADPFPRDAKPASDLFEGLLLKIGHPKPPFEDLALTGIEAMEHRREVLA